MPLAGEPAAPPRLHAEKSAPTLQQWSQVLSNSVSSRGRPLTVTMERTSDHSPTPGVLSQHGSIMAPTGLQPVASGAGQVQQAAPGAGQVQQQPAQLPGTMPGTTSPVIASSPPTAPRKLGEAPVYQYTTMQNAPGLQQQQQQVINGQTIRNGLQRTASPVREQMIAQQPGNANANRSFEPQAVQNRSFEPHAVQAGSTPLRTQYGSGPSPGFTYRTLQGAPAPISRSTTTLTTRSSLRFS